MNMNNKLKITCLVIIGLICLYIISFTMDLLLNKKYAVDEIPFTNRQQGLVGIQEVIERDYMQMLYLNIGYVFVLIVISIILLTIKKK